MNAVACYLPPISLQIKTEVFHTGYAVVHMSRGASILGRRSLCMISVRPLGAEERKWIQGTQLFTRLPLPATKVQQGSEETFI